MTYDIDNKTILVTGGTGGLGVALCKEFIKYKCNLVVTDVSLEKLKELKSKLLKNKHEECIIKIKEMDVTRELDVRRVNNLMLKSFKGTDILINCAGYLHYDNIFNLSVEKWNKVIDVNLRGMFFTTKYFAQSMKKKKYGKIINISSVAAISGVDGGSAYSSSKSGILGLTRVLAKELAEYNINVNAVSPGPLEGEFLNQNADQDGIEMRISKTLLNRIGQYRDIVKPILFLSSCDSDWITGQNLFVDGGYTVQ